MVTESVRKVYCETRIKCTVLGNNNIFILATKLYMPACIGKFRDIVVCVFSSLFMHNIFLLNILNEYDDVVPFDIMHYVYAYSFAIYILYFA